MSNTTTPSKRRGLSLLLAILMVISIFGFQVMSAEESYAYTANQDNGIYCTQIGSGSCVLSSVTMMLRSMAKLNGISTWASIKQTEVQKVACISGYSVYHSFTYAGMSVSYGEFASSDKKAQLIAILAKHPEGFVIYDRGVPHGIFLTRYDKASDTFYVGDPAIDAKEIPMSSSWNAKCVSSSSDPKTKQTATINALDGYWYVSKYNGVAAAAYDKAMLEQIKKEQEEQKPDPTPTPTPTPGPDPDPGPDDIDGLQGDGGNNSGDNSVKFAKVCSYRSGQFTDVPSDKWYAKSVASAYEMGLMVGMSADTFGVNGNVTLAQSVTLAARVYSIYSGDQQDFTPMSGQRWYMPYLEYCSFHDLIDSGTYDLIKNYPNKEATRQEFANIVGQALPLEAMNVINYIQMGYIPDVNENMTGADTIYNLYRAGVLTGTGGNYFNPKKNITRAEVSAVISRMGDSSLRLKF